MVWGSFILSSVVSMQLCVLQTRWCVEEPALSLCSFLSMAWTQVPWIQVTDWLVRIKRHWVDKVRANTRRWSVANPVILAMSPNWFPISSSPRECFSSVTKVTMHTGMSNCIGISNSDPRTRSLISRHPLPILIVINGLFVMRCQTSEFCRNQTWNFLTLQNWQNFILLCSNTDWRGQGHHLIPRLCVTELSMFRKTSLLPDFSRHNVSMMK